MLNAVPARPGLFMTRNSRVVEITHSQEVQEQVGPGQPPRTRTIWIGNIRKADGKTVDTKATWNPDGGFANPRGVASQFDLAQVIALPKQTPMGARQAPAIAAASLEPAAAPAEAPVPSPAAAETASVELAPEEPAAPPPFLPPTVEQLERLGYSAEEAANIAAHEATRAKSGLAPYGPPSPPPPAAA